MVSFDINNRVYTCPLGKQFQFSELTAEPKRSQSERIVCERCGAGVLLIFTGKKIASTDGNTFEAKIFTLGCEGGDEEAQLTKNIPLQST